MTNLIGMPIEKAKVILKEMGKKFTVIHHNDRRMHNFDQILVVRVKEEGEEVILTASKFLIAATNIN